MMEARATAWVASADVKASFDAGETRWPVLIVPELSSLGRSVGQIAILWLTNY